MGEEDPDRGSVPASLNRDTARGFVADFTRRVTDGQPVRGVLNKNSTPPSASKIQLHADDERRPARDARRHGQRSRHRDGLPRQFIVALPYSGSIVTRNPRPFSDQVLRVLSDKDNIAQLNELDPHDGGLADIWSIQFSAGDASAKS